MEGVTATPATLERTAGEHAYMQCTGNVPTEYRQCNNSVQAM